MTTGAGTAGVAGGVGVAAAAASEAGPGAGSGARVVDTRAGEPVS